MDKLDLEKKMRKIFGKDESISELKDHEGSMQNLNLKEV